MTENSTPERSAERVIAKLRAVSADMQARIDEYNKWLDLYSLALAGDDPVTDAESAAAHVHDIGWAEQAFEKLESITHIHTGSGDHMDFRAARRAVTQVASGKPLGRWDY